MNGAEVVNHTRPEKFHLQTFHRAGQVACAASQAGQTGAQGGIEPFDVGGVEATNLSLRLHQQAAGSAPIAMYQASLDVRQAFALVAFDDLDDIQFWPGDALGPTPLAVVPGGKQLFQYAGIGSKTIDTEKDWLDDTSRSLTDLRHDLQDEVLVPLQRYGAPDEQARKDTQGGRDPGDLSLQLYPHLVGLHLSQLDDPPTDEAILDPLGMVTSLQLPAGHGALVYLKGEYDGG